MALPRRAPTGSRRTSTQRLGAACWAARLPGTTPAANNDLITTAVIIERCINAPTPSTRHGHALENDGPYAVSVALQRYYNPFPHFSIPVQSNPPAVNLNDSLNASLRHFSVSAFSCFLGWLAMAPSAAQSSNSGTSSGTPSVAC